MFGFNIFKKRPKIDYMHFKGPKEAFEYACHYMQRTPFDNQKYIGLAKQKTTPPNHLLKPMYEKMWDVEIATTQGSVLVSTCESMVSASAAFLNQHIKEVEPGDLVLVQSSSYEPNKPVDHKDQIFMIISTLNYSIRIDKNMFEPLLDPVFYPKE